MNLPSGKILKTNLDASSTDMMALLDELKRKRFCGYVALTIKGNAGVEEGTVLLDTGKIVGCTYEYYAFCAELAGEKAFQRILNAAPAKTGVFDVVELTAEQIHLALAFHEDSVFVPSDQSLRHLKLPAYSTSFEDEIKNVTTSKDLDPSKKYKLYGLRKTDTPAQLPEGKTP